MPRTPNLLLCSLCLFLACRTEGASPVDDPEPTRAAAGLGPASLMTLTTAQSSVIADGAHSTLVTATWTDPAGRPLVGQSVYFTSDNPNAQLSPSQPQTNCNGQVKVAWSSTKAGQQTLWAGGPTYRLARAKVSFTCPGTFLRPRSWPIFSAQAVSLAAKDFNADGFIDLAAAEPSANVVEVFQGFGNGLFDVPVSYAVGSKPQGILNLDINGDGVVDLLTVNSGGNSLSLLVGSPNGGFTNQRTYTVGNTPLALAGADLNADGNMDVVVVNSASNTASVLLGNGNSLAAAVTYTTDSVPVALTPSDLNADGRLDLIVANANANTLSIFLGNGDGTLGAASAVSLPASPTGLAAADYNGDRRQDLAVSCANANAVYLLYGNNDGTFATPRALSTPTLGPAQLRAMDVNRDGYADLLVANSGGNTLAYLQGAANGNLTLVTNVAAGNNPNGLAVADFTSDGILDIGSTNAGGPVAILAGTTAANFAALPHNVFYPSAYSDIVAADFDTDGFSDLFSVSGGIQSQFQSLGNGAFAQPRRSYLAGGAGTIQFGVGVSDLNHDSKVDAVVTYYPAAFSVENVYLNSAGNLVLGANINGGIVHAMQVALGDLNKDGNVDLAIIHTSYTAGMTLCRGNGDGTFAPGVLYLLGIAIAAGGYNNLAIADMNADGNGDVVAASRSDTKVNVMLGDGNFSFTSTTVLQMAYYNNDLRIADLNGDSLPDVVTALDNGYKASVALNTGSGTFATPVTYLLPGTANATAIAVADFTRDSFLDLAVASANTNKVYIFPGTGTGTFGAPASYIVGSNPTRLAVGDFDGNGQADLAVSLLKPASAVVLLNSGCP